MLPILQTLSTIISFEHDAKPRLIHADLADWSNDGPMGFFASPGGHRRETVTFGWSTQW